MNIGELAKAVAGATSTSEAAARAAVLAIFDQISNAVANGEEVSINGFGQRTLFRFTVAG